MAGKILDQPISECSGGEASRSGPPGGRGANVPILDEPTNHLDIWACDASKRRSRVEGTVIVVSHDRYFLNAVSDLIIVMDPGRVEVVYGNYELYESLRATREAEDAAKRKAAPAATTGEVKVAPTGGPTKAPKRKRKFPYRKVEELEQEVMEQEELVAELEGKLASPEVYRDANLVKDTMTDFEDAKERLKTLYEHWEEAVELNGRNARSRKRLTV